MVRQYAHVYNVSYYTMDRVIQCESQYNPYVQSNHRYKEDRPHEGVVAGQREQSFGLVQIHLPAHPHITRQQAESPEFAVEFLAKSIADGQLGKWSCARQLALL